VPLAILQQLRAQEDFLARVSESFVSVHRKALCINRSITDLRWINHLASAAELPSLRGEWYFWDAETLRGKSHEVITSSVHRIIEKMNRDLSALESASQQDMVGNLLI